MGDTPTGFGRLFDVPLFPLPNVVLFPRAVLPLHIFEPRYKAMTSHALATERRVAMALLKPGWEKNYHGKAEIEPVVCVGQILSHEKLGDGKYNFLLQGSDRGRVCREWLSEGEHPPYRIAQVELLDDHDCGSGGKCDALEIDFTEARQQLSEIFLHRVFAETDLGRQFIQLLRGPISTTGIADLAAFHYIDDIAAKQQLLAELDPRERVRRVVNALKLIPPTVDTETRLDRMGLN